MKYKLYCIFARESVDKMKGNRGKMAAQAGHAFLHSYWDAMGMSSPIDIRDHVNLLKREQAEKYQASEHAYKICLAVDTIKELEELHLKYKNICGTSLVKDAGFTVFDGPTITCLGIGPIAECYIGEDLFKLKVLI